MSTTVTFSAQLRTRKTSSATNAKTDSAAQEYYGNGDYNYVGIVSFGGMGLKGKVIQQITLKVTAGSSGYGAGHEKTVYLRKSKYQVASASGISGKNYYGDALGTFTGSFYGNTTSYTFDGQLLTNLIAYIAAGNNTFCLYNPSPVSSGEGYSNNYMVWNAATLTVTYEEGVSAPSVSSTSVQMGSPVTIYTNRLSTSATHTLSYTIGTTSGLIAENVGASFEWVPEIALAMLIPNATVCVCQISCTTWFGGTSTGTRSCSISLSVPLSVAPVIESLSITDADSTITARFDGFVQNKSRLNVVIQANGAEGSTIESYRTSIAGYTYTNAFFTTDLLPEAGTETLIVTVTDTRGRSTILRREITILPYSPPSITALRAERCNAAGEAQPDGTSARITVHASTSPVERKNTIDTRVYIKESTGDAWMEAAILTSADYTADYENLVIAHNLDVLKSYDVKLVLTDAFGTAEQSISIATKQVMMDFFRDGTGIAFGKMAESSGSAEFGWPLTLSTALTVENGGTGAKTVAAARKNLGLGNTGGALPIANGGTGQTTAAKARNALGLGNTTGALPVANGGTGATDAMTARANLGISL